MGNATHREEERLRSLLNGLNRAHVGSRRGNRSGVVQVQMRR